MNEQALGNLRFLGHIIPDNFKINALINELDQMIHASPNVELLDSEIYLIYKDNAFVIARGIVGTLNFDSNEINVFDVSSTSISKEEFLIQGEYFSDALREVEEYLKNHDLNEFIGSFKWDDWSKLTIMVPKTGTFKWP
jgi:hypothetical protein